MWHQNWHVHVSLKKGTIPCQDQQNQLLNSDVTFNCQYCCIIHGLPLDYVTIHSRNMFSLAAQKDHSRFGKAKHLSASIHKGFINLTCQYQTASLGKQQALSTCQIYVEEVWCHSLNWRLELSSSLLDWAKGTKLSGREFRCEDRGECAKIGDFWGGRKLITVCREPKKAHAIKVISNNQSYLKLSNCKKAWPWVVLICNGWARQMHSAHRFQCKCFSSIRSVKRKHSQMLTTATAAHAVDAWSKKSQDLHLPLKF